MIKRNDNKLQSHKNANHKKTAGSYSQLPAVYYAHNQVNQ